MIVQNMMFRDIDRQDRSCRDTNGMTLTMTVSPLQWVGWSGATHGGPFVMVERDDRQIMFKTVASLIKNLDVFTPHNTPLPSESIYIRRLQPFTPIPCGTASPLRISSRDLNRAGKA